MRLGRLRGLAVRLLLPALVVRGLLVVALLRIRGVRVGVLLVAVSVLLRVLLLVAVRVGGLLLVGVGVLLPVLLLVGQLRRRLGLFGGPRPGGLLGDLREAVQVLGVRGVLPRRPVLPEGAQVAQVVAGDPAVQLLPAAADGVQGLGEDGLEGTELDVDVFVGVAAQGLRVMAALGSVLVLVALLVGAGPGAEELRGRGRPNRGSW